MNYKKRRALCLRNLRIHKNLFTGFQHLVGGNSFLLPSDIWKKVFEFSTMDIIYGPHLRIQELNVLRAVCKGMDHVRMIGLEVLINELLHYLPQGFDWNLLIADPMHFSKDYINRALGALNLIQSTGKAKIETAHLLLEHFLDDKENKYCFKWHARFTNSAIIKRFMIKEEYDLIRDNRQLAIVLKSFSQACYENVWFMTVLEFRKKLYKQGITTLAQLTLTMDQRKNKSRFLCHLVRCDKYDCRMKNCNNKAASGCRSDYCGLCCNDTICIRHQYKTMISEQDSILATSFLRLDN